jgi:hypothetical protein
LFLLLCKSGWNSGLPRAVLIRGVGGFEPERRDKAWEFLALRGDGWPVCDAFHQSNHSKVHITVRGVRSNPKRPSIQVDLVLLFVRNTKSFWLTVVPPLGVCGLIGAARVDPGSFINGELLAIAATVLRATAALSCSTAGGLPPDNAGSCGRNEGEKVRGLAIP